MAIIFVFPERNPLQSSVPRQVRNRSSILIAGGLPEDYGSNDYYNYSESVYYVCSVDARIHDGSTGEIRKVLVF